MDTYILHICIMLLKLIQNGFSTGRRGHVCGKLWPTHTPAHTQHHKYGCNIGTPKTTDTLLINTFSNRAEGLKCKITCWSCWMEWKFAHWWCCCWTYTVLNTLKPFFIITVCWRNEHFKRAPSRWLKYCQKKTLKPAKRNVNQCYVEVHLFWFLMPDVLMIFGPRWQAGNQTSSSTTNNLRCPLKYRGKL